MQYADKCNSKSESCVDRWMNEWMNEQTEGKWNWWWMLILNREVELGWKYNP